MMRIPGPLAAVLLSLGMLAASQAGAQGAQAFPDKPIRMIVPVGAGGSTDIMLRQLAVLAEPLLGQPIVIINRPGASGMMGVAGVARAPADGYTIGGVWSGPVSMAPHIEPSGYNFEDYVMVAPVTEAPGVLCVAPNFPANDGRQLLEELKRNPGKYTYGTEGVGGFVHLSSERIFSAAGIQAVAVPFSGANQTVTAFLGGHIDIFGGGISTVLEFARQGKAKCLLVTSAKRHPALPETHSLDDVGLSTSETLLWRAVIAPAGTPPQHLARLEKAFGEAARMPAFRQFALSRGESPWLVDRASGQKYMSDEYRTMGSLVQRLGLKKNR
jgi:tripartite-type tricarboxylate transporter receptor subunit TctC